jgi:hypothetical protein
MSVAYGLPTRSLAGWHWLARSRLPAFEMLRMGYRGTAKLWPLYGRNTISAATHVTIDAVSAVATYQGQRRAAPPSRPG